MRTVQPAEEGVLSAETPSAIAGALDVPEASRMLLASCYGDLGRAEEARAAWAELLKTHPSFERIAEGLAKAGLP